MIKKKNIFINCVKRILNILSMHYKFAYALDVNVEFVYANISNSVYKIIFRAK